MDESHFAYSVKVRAISFVQTLSLNILLWKEVINTMKDWNSINYWSVSFYNKIDDNTNGP